MGPKDTWSVLLNWESPERVVGGETLKWNCDVFWQGQKKRSSSWHCNKHWKAQEREGDKRKRAREVDRKMRDGDVGGGAELGPVDYVVFGCNFTCFLSTALQHLPFTPPLSKPSRSTSATVLYYVYIHPGFNSQTWNLRMVYAGAKYNFLNCISLSLPVIVMLHIYAAFTSSLK